MSRRRPRQATWLLLGLGLPLASSFHIDYPPQSIHPLSPSFTEQPPPQRRILSVACTRRSTTQARIRWSRRRSGALQGSSSLVWSECDQGGGRGSTNEESSSSSSSTTPGLVLPPWLSQYHQMSEVQVTEQIQWLEFTLMEQGFLVADIGQIVSALQKVSDRDAVLAAGMVDFLRVLLGLRQDESGALFVTTPVLLASIIHYADCVAVRRRGVPDTLREALLDQFASSPGTTTVPKSSDGKVQTQSSLVLPGMERIIGTSSAVLARKEEPPLGMARDPVSTTTTSSSSSSSNNPYEVEVRLICKGAARVKRAECLAHAVLQHRVVTPSQAARLRDLYLMSMDQDWRSLALRVVACLYRLEGLLRVQSSDYTEKTQQMVQVAREALRIYAPLAQRLGMHRLKAMIEERAFRLQYRRQYRAVSSLYHETGEVMQSVSTYLQSNIQHILAEDEALVDQLQSLQVVARVKEPYSFWRKLLNQKARGRLMPSSSDEEESNADNRERRSLSVAQVNDAVALRVILQARKLEPNEPDDITRARERMLCYYVQHLIRGKWPETDTERIKDYIRNPKPNGYRSLHHTSQIASRGIKFPFEVQVRSAEMHARAEYGPSAHWDYKLSGRQKSLPSATAGSDKALSLHVDDNKASCIIVHPERKATSAVVVENPDNYVDALTTAQENMLRNQIYVFIMGDGNEGTEQGELISIPANSSIKKAVEEIECLLPAKVQVWKNGRLADKEDKLENGDVMMIGV